MGFYLLMLVGLAPCCYYRHYLLILVRLNWSQNCAHVPQFTITIVVAGLIAHLNFLNHLVVKLVIEHHH